MGKVKKRGKGKEIENKPRTKERVADALELPKEIILNIPKIVMLGNKSLIIQNFKGVFLFEDESIKVNTSSGIIIVCGRKLKITEINSEDLCIEGKIKSIEFANQ